jgi:hypothetical protein
MSESESSRWKDVGKLGVIIGGAVWYGDVEIPDWWLIVGVAALGAVAVAYVASGKIYDLFDDPRPVRLVQINAVSDEGVAAWKMSRDQFNDMSVEWGPLYPHTGSEYETYEVFAYNPDANAAVGTWRRHSVPGSDVLGQPNVEDLEQQIADLRGRLEPEARRLKELKVRLPVIARTIDYERAEAMNAALDPSSPNQVADRSVDEIIRDELPDYLQPGSIRNGDLSSLVEQGDGDDPDDLDGDMSIIVEDDGDALEPTGEIANDGGRPT